MFCIHLGLSDGLLCFLLPDSLYNRCAGNTYTVYMSTQKHLKKSQIQFSITICRIFNGFMHERYFTTFVFYYFIFISIVILLQEM